EHQRADDARWMVAGDDHVGRVHRAVFVQIVGAVDGGRGDDAGGVIAYGDHVGGVDEGVAGAVAGLTDLVAEVEDVGGGEGGVAVGLDGDLEPFLFDGVIGEGDLDAIAAAGACAAADGDRGGGQSAPTGGGRI